MGRFTLDDSRTATLFDRYRLTYQTRKLEFEDWVVISTAYGITFRWRSFFIFLGPRGGVEGCIWLSLAFIRRSQA